MSDNLLPTEFTALEFLAHSWSLATQREREQRRRVSTAAEMRAVYDTLLPRLNAILDYLNRYTLDDLPHEARSLLYLTLAFAEIAPFVECYKGEPRVPNSFEETRFVAVHGDRVG